MDLRIQAEVVPLETGADGVTRVRGSRVTLDTLVASFHLGAAAEEISQRYPTLQLADVYAVLAYYLRHQAEVDVYLREQGAAARELRAEIETRFSPAGIRERLMARRRQQTVASDDPSGRCSLA